MSEPMLAVHTSLVELRLYQITAVYEAMLPRQGLRFLLVDGWDAEGRLAAGA
jgi:hypothetical protein